MTDEVIDVSDRVLTREEWRQMRGSGNIYRLNKKQAGISSPENSCLFDMYESIPAGSFYTAISREFHDGITLSELEREGSPCQRISRKRFDGFTTGIPYNDVYAFDCFPDRNISIDWSLLNSCPSISAKLWTSIHREFSVLNEEGVRASIGENYRDWQRLSPRIHAQAVIDDAKYLKESGDFTLEELSDAENRPYESWEDVLKGAMENGGIAHPTFENLKLLMGREGTEVPMADILEYANLGSIELPKSFKIEGCRGSESDPGFIPETTLVSSPREFSDFVVRFLSFEEKGTPDIKVEVA